jgi:hypothetical protein
MVAFIFFCAGVSALTGVRMIAAAIFGARRASAKAQVQVPDARVVRDARGDAAVDTALPAVARVAVGLLLIAVGFAAIFLVRSVPR